MPIDVYDVVIAGGGPAGLAAALTLGRARKRVLLCDAPPRRNAAAVHVHNFVTRDGVTPDEFRQIARAQLAAYANVEIRDARVEQIGGERGAFRVTVAGAAVGARRALLCVGMIDEPPAIDGLVPIWGHTAFQCPYCHGWEVRDRRFAHLAENAAALEFTLFLRGWTPDVLLLTNAAFEIDREMRDRLTVARVQVDERRIARLAGEGQRLRAVVFADGSAVERDVLFLHPPQRQADIVLRLGVALDEKGYVQVHELRRETSMPGVYAAGDLTTPMQSAILAAASGMQTAAALNRELTLDLVAP
jgi:thioredoxin reductase